MKSLPVMRKMRLLTLAVSFIVATALVSMSASAYVSYSYGTNYNDGVNTQAAAQAVSNSLNSMGYSPNYRADSTNANAFSDMGNAQVWFFNGHGGPGSIIFKGTGDVGIYANHISAPGYYSIQDRNDIGDLALIVFVSCNSGTTSTSGLGNLVDMSTSKGVDSAVGFTSTIIAANSDYWARQFAIHLDEQKVISQSAAEATNDVYWRYRIGLDPFGGTQNYVVRGSLSVTIDPARAGY